MKTKEISFFSTSLNREITLDTLILDDSFRTLVMLHGLGGDRHDWFDKSDICEYADRYRFNIICPDGEDSFYINEYAPFVSQELPDFIGNGLGLHGLAVGGLSMGGYGALIAGLMAPLRYSHIICLSGAMPVYKLERMEVEGNPDIRDLEYRHRIFGDFMKIRNTYRDPEWLIRRNVTNPPILIACGRDDNHIPDTHSFIDAIEKLNVRYTYIENGGRHDWEYWNRMLHPSFEFLTKC